MKSVVIFIFLAAAAAVPASATPITWQASSSLSGVWDPYHQLPGLTAGTPWTLHITFEPDVPPRALGAEGWDCNVYNVGAVAIFQLGGFTYTQAGGQVFTNSILPVDNCRSTAPSWSPPGLIQFAWLGSWTQEPGAWNLNNGPKIFMAGYYDAVHQDGSLPTIPAFGPGGSFSGIEYEGGGNLFGFYSSFNPHLVAAPTAVPEPATLTMFGAGLALLARRRLRRR